MTESALLDAWRQIERLVGREHCSPASVVDAVAYLVERTRTPDPAPDTRETLDPPEPEPIEDLIERSSLGTPEARAARARVPEEVARRILDRVPPPAGPSDYLLNYTPPEPTEEQAQRLLQSLLNMPFAPEDAPKGWCPECDGRSQCAPGTCPGVGAPEAARELHEALDDLQGLAHRLGFCCYAAALDPNAPCPWHTEGEER